MKKILIVEDDSANREFIVNCLLTEGKNYTLLNASDGKKALEITRKKMPDLLIMDWHMPGMSGIEALQELKSNPATKDIPVIIFTGVMTSSPDLKMALERGALDFITKPV